MTNTSVATAAPAATAGTASSIATSLPAMHDAAQQARNLRQVLQDDKQRIGCFLGAGCPLGVYDEKGIKSIVLIPAVVELTERIAGELKMSDAPATTKFKANWDSLVAECKATDGKDPTVEDRKSVV